MGRLDFARAAGGGSGEDGRKPLDQMVKPIRDAMRQLVYHDDSQICYSETIHVSIDAAIKLRRASAILLVTIRKRL